MFQRLVLLLKKIAPAILLGAILLLFALVGKGIPCVFYRFTGLQCPGCGGTRMILALLRLDFVSAFRYNAGLMIVLPILLGVVSLSVWRFLRGENWRFTPRQNVVISILCVFMLVFCVFRNIFSF